MEELALLGGARSAMICDSRRSCRQCVGATPLILNRHGSGTQDERTPLWVMITETEVVQRLILNLTAETKSTLTTSQ